MAATSGNSRFPRSDGTMVPAIGRRERARRGRGTLALLLACLAPGLHAVETFLGEYFAGSNFDRFAFECEDPVIDFSWGSDGPIWPPESFSVRWTARFAPPESGMYLFQVSADGGVRLWVDGQPVIDDWTRRSAARSGSAHLRRDRRIHLHLEYFQEDGAASVRLDWRRPSGGWELVQPAAPAATAPLAPFLGGTFPRRAHTRYHTPEVFTALGLEKTTFLIHDPRTGRLFTGARTGIIHVVENDPEATSKEVYLDLGPGVTNLLNMALHLDFGVPDSPRAGTFFVYYALTDRIRLSRFTAHGEGEVSPETEHILIQQRADRIDHLGGGLLFGDDGLLYLTIGDLHLASHAQSLTSLFNSCVLRIDVDEDPRRSRPIPVSLSDRDPEGFNRGYGIPLDNPFVGAGPDVLEEYYALGLRSPHRMTKDRETGEMYIGDVGSNYAGSFEEVNVLRAGANYGWPFREGRHDIAAPDVSQGLSGVAPRPRELIGELTDPIHSYSRADGSCIIGGYVYRGAALPELRGRYVFADHTSGAVWALDLEDGSRSRLTTFWSATTFGEDADGELYLGNLASPLARLSIAPEESEVPPRLSDVAAFEDLTELVAVPGLLPYELNMPLWSDAAVKRRWIGIPNDGWPNSPEERIVNPPSGAWSFPVGTVFVKHFSLVGREGGERRVETRFLVHGEDDYYGVTYRWREDHSDADLLAGGLDEWVTTGGGEQLWHYPSPEECLRCHNAAAGRVLGVRTAQLNRRSAATGVDANQLTRLAAAGFLTAPASDPGDLPRLTPRDDSGAYNRAWMRAYLEANCALCHRPGGPGHGLFDARFETPLPLQGLFGGRLINAIGLDDPRVLVAGDPERSALWHRLIRRDVTAMPPLGSRLVDELAVARLESWIRSENPRFAERPIARQNERPIAGSIEVRVEPGVPVAFELPAFDPDGDPLDFRVSPPPSGELSGLGARRRFLVDQAEAPIELAFRASDGDLESDAGLVRFVLGPVLRRGDANGDGLVDISDVVATLRALFLFVSLPCLDAADANDDGRIDISDVVVTLNALHEVSGTGTTPGAPLCSVDPTGDRLGCAGYDACP